MLDFNRKNLIFLSKGGILFQIIRVSFSNVGLVFTEQNARYFKLDCIVVRKTVRNKKYVQKNGKHGQLWNVKYHHADK